MRQEILYQDSIQKRYIVNVYGYKKYGTAAVLEKEIQLIVLKRTKIRN